MQDRNFKISLIRATGSEITRVVTFRDLVQYVLKDEALQAEGEKLRLASRGDKSVYDKLKRATPGFVIGEFSYRNADSCLEYAPVLGFDIDKLDSEEKLIEVYQKLKSWPFTFVLMPSISGQGLRLLIYTDATKETHKDYYTYACKVLSSLLKIPTKSSIKDALKKINDDTDYIKEYLDNHAHIDDATSDISRFWYYSGIKASQFYANKESAVFTYRRQVEEPSPAGGNYEGADYPYTFTEQDKVDYLVDEIERTSTDITKGVTEWFKIGLALYDELGSQAEQYFYRVSQFHPEYSEASARREWRRVESKYKPGKVTIGSFYKWCADYGVTIDFNALVKKHSDKFNKQKEERRQAVKNIRKSGVLQDLDIETSIIASCIYNPEYISSIYDACPKFSESVFSDEANALYFQAIRKLNANQQSVNPLSVASKVKYDGIDDAGEHIARIKGQAMDILSLTTNCEIAYSLYIKRQIIDICRQTESELTAKDIDAFDCLDNLHVSYANLSDFGASRTEYDAFAVATKVQSRFDKISKAKKENNHTITGVPTGLTSEDNLTAGYQPSDLVIIAARPGMGKTSKAMKSAIKNASAGIPIGVFSLEMSAEQLGQRMAAMVSGINGFKIRNAELNDTEAQQFMEAIGEIGDWPLYIDDKGGANIMHIDRVARKWKRKHDIQALIIDYLQLITSANSGDSRHLELGRYTKHLKSLAKSLNIPIICLSQLSRAVEIRGGSKRPQLSDLRESGSIEEDADIVQFIYRPEYYGITEDADGQSLEGAAEIIYAKHRNGALRTITCLFDQETTEFYDNMQYAAIKADVNMDEVRITKKANKDEEVPF